MDDEVETLDDGGVTHDLAGAATDDQESKEEGEEASQDEDRGMRMRRVVPAVRKRSL